MAVCTKRWTDKLDLVLKGKTNLTSKKQNKCLANAKRPCDCCVLCYTIPALYFRLEGPLSANISGGRGQVPATLVAVGVKRLEISYGAEILTDDYFVLSQYTHLIDRRTDRQNYDSNTVRCSRAVKRLYGQLSSVVVLIGWRRQVVMTYSWRSCICSFARDCNWPYPVMHCRY